MNKQFKFKSVSPFFEKEREGIKNNTVRLIDLNDERFLELIHSYMEGYGDKQLEIEIINGMNPAESFKRFIKDISIWDNIMIITWEHKRQQTKQTEQEKYHPKEVSKDEKLPLRGLGEKSSLNHVNKTADSLLIINGKPCDFPMNGNPINPKIKLHIRTDDEFNLSDKVINASDWGFMEVLNIDNVREFIKRLKEEINLELGGDFNNTSDFDNIIDKLAGDSLNGNKTSEKKSK